MLNFDYEISITDKARSLLKEKKINVITALAKGYSNAAISNEFGIPIKTIERILNELNRKFHTSSRHYNLRVRLIVSLLMNDLLIYSQTNKPRRVENLNSKLKKTLVLSAIGLSNKAIASIFCLSEKAIELRFSHLFDYFNVDTKSQSTFNPRVSLFISAYCRDNIKIHHLRRLYRETTADRLEQIFDNKTEFLYSLEEEHRLIG